MGLFNKHLFNMHRHSFSWNSLCLRSLTQRHFLGSLDKSKTPLKLSWPAQMFILPQAKVCVSSFPRGQREAICRTWRRDRDSLHPLTVLETRGEWDPRVYGQLAYLIIHTHIHANHHSHMKISTKSAFPHFPPPSLPILPWKKNPHLLTWSLLVCVFFYGQKDIFSGWIIALLLSWFQLGQS